MPRHKSEPTRKKRAAKKQPIQVPAGRISARELERFSQQMEQFGRTASDLLYFCSKAEYTDLPLQPALFRWFGTLQRNLENVHRPEYAMRLQSAIQESLLHPTPVLVEKGQKLSKRFRANAIRLYLESLGLLPGFRDLSTNARKLRIPEQLIGKSLETARMIILNKLLTQIGRLDDPGLKRLQERLIADVTLSPGHYKARTGPASTLSPRDLEELRLHLPGPEGRRLIFNVIDPRQHAKLPKAERAAYNVLFRRFGLYQEKAETTRAIAASRNVKRGTVSDDITLARYNILKGILEATPK